MLDEADEMLSMGFRDDLESILAVTPKEKNTLLFSATMSDDVKKIADRYMIDPVEIEIGRRNSGSDDVTHICYKVKARDRYPALKRIVDFYPDIYGRDAKYIENTYEKFSLPKVITPDSQKGTEIASNS